MSVGKSWGTMSIGTQNLLYNFYVDRWLTYCGIEEVAMDLLDIHLLGSYQVSRGNIPTTGFESNKVRALLAYLAVEADIPHQRRKLAATAR